MYQPEKSAKIINFPLERARTHHLERAFVNLQFAESQIQPDLAPVTQLFQSPAEKAAAQEFANEAVEAVAEVIEPTATDRLAEIRRQIDEAA